ncbi:hypothetical protein [Methylobacterium indicum]|uniref:hypothetical protein n=1 Tax=Methylobacterium indicum TaxID=1775910 RepID=UPI000B2B3A1C|nr:hypothetical protein [Methylobacterium indicum]
MARIVEIRLTGSGKQDALIRFEPGPNVVTGDSDTGKSYLLRLIDFILGAAELSKIIDEASGYDKGWLEMSDGLGNTLTLERHLTGGDVRAYNDTISNIVQQARSEGLDNLNDIEGGELLLWRRQGKSTASDITSKIFPFFGMPDDVQVRENADGKTQRLSIRTLLPIVLVDEEAIITEGSPVLRGGFAQTAEKRMFSYLLTGKDDRGVTRRDAREIVKARAQAKKDLIDELLIPLNTRLKDRIESEEDESIDRLGATIGSLSEALARNADERSRLRQQRSNIYNKLLKSETQISAVNGLLTRYALLQKRYDSDLMRLDFMAESANFYEGLQETVCPMCGQVLGEEDHDHSSDIKGVATADEIYAAASAEAAKIRGLQSDLKNTIEDLEEREAFWQQQKVISTSELKLIDGHLDEFLAPARTRVSNTLKELVEKRLELESARSDRLEAFRLNEIKNKLERELSESASRTTWAGLDPKAITDLCREIEAVLREWSWREEVRVEFQEDKFDIKVDGKLRRSHGKGFRAVMHAALSIAILKYCKKTHKPHPGFIVLDSPLTTVKQRSGQKAVVVPEKDRIRPIIEPMFWRSMSKIDPSIQIIILDNKEPPSNLQGALNVQLFAGPDAELGQRGGFIP